MKNSLLIFSCLLRTMTAFSQAPPIVWKSLNGGNDNDNARRVVQTTDGGYIAAGETTFNDTIVYSHGGREMFIVKTNSLGILEWQKNFGGAGSESAYDIKANAGRWLYR